MPRPDRAVVHLTTEEIGLIVEALDSHEYWQLSDPTWRHSGAVILPGDDAQRWADRPTPTPEQREAIAEIGRCRSLADRLRERLRLIAAGG
jgi:hypothetical protein